MEVLTRSDPRLVSVALERTGVSRQAFERMDPRMRANLFGVMGPEAQQRTFAEMRLGNMAFNRLSANQKSNLWARADNNSKAVLLSYSGFDRATDFQRLDMNQAATQFERFTLQREALEAAVR
jgi:hypothetical protein